MRSADGEHLTHRHTTSDWEEAARSLSHNRTCSCQVCSRRCGNLCGRQHLSRHHTRRYLEYGSLKVFKKSLVIWRCFFYPCSLHLVMYFDPIRSRSYIACTYIRVLCWCIPSIRYCILFFRIRLYLQCKQYVVALIKKNLP
jgi:hypothetical protein